MHYNNCAYYLFWIIEFQKKTRWKGKLDSKGENYVDHAKKNTYLQH